MLVIQVLTAKAALAATVEPVALPEMLELPAIQGILEIPATAVEVVAVVLDRRLGILPVVLHTMLRQILHQTRVLLAALHQLAPALAVQVAQ